MNKDEMAAKYTEYRGKTTIKSLVAFLARFPETMTVRAYYEGEVHGIVVEDENEEYGFFHTKELKDA